MVPILFWPIYALYLIPNKVNVWLGFAITGLVGYVTEFIVGFVCSEILNQTLQEWQNSPFKFVGGWSCLFLWFSNAVLYYWLVFCMPVLLVESLNPHKKDIPNAKSKQVVQ